MNCVTAVRGAALVALAAAVYNRTAVDHAVAEAYQRKKRKRERIATTPIIVQT